MAVQGVLAILAVILLVVVAVRQRPISLTHLAAALFVAALLLAPVRAFAVWAIGHH